MLLNTPLSQLVESEPASGVCDINLDMSLPENTHSEPASGVCDINLDMSLPENTNSKIAGTLTQLMTRWQASAEGSGDGSCKEDVWPPLW